MNVHKHLAGLALFTVILGSAILIHNFLAYPMSTIPSTSTQLPFSVREGAPQPVDYRVQLVSLDFINKQSYTALTLERERGQAEPQTLWVTTYFFSPEYPGRVWTSAVEIRQPFAQGDRTEYVASASCDFCASPDAPRAGYFARVKVSADYADPGFHPLDRDIAKAERVVVQAERKVAMPIVR